MTNSTQTTNQRLTIAGKQYLLRSRPDGSYALFARVGRKWSGGVVYAADRQAVGAATGVDVGRIV